MNFLKSIYLKKRLFYFLGLVIFLYISGNFYGVFTILANLGLLSIILLLLVDIGSIYLSRGEVTGFRDLPEKLSNGDENNIFIHIRNRYGFLISISVLDELPFQFQQRDKAFNLKIERGEEKVITYSLRPTQRGIFSFGWLNVFVSSRIGFIERRFKLGSEVEIPVYPSFLQLKKFEFYAISNNLSALGLKKIRKIGHNYEFDQIRNYIPGDDVRSINWKATARSTGLMVNQYQDERAQNIYCLINMGRVMKMPFNELTLLDHSINSSLVLLNVALKKDDKAGLITFNQKPVAFLQAERRRTQLRSILEVLYSQETKFGEASYEALYNQVRRSINQRSLLMLYTNFESLSSLERELPYLRKLAKRHLLVVVFFINTEIHKIISKKSDSIEDIYINNTAKKFLFEKKMIVMELKKFGIHSILVKPEELTIASINKYLEFKNRGFI